jgi:hypothetical protein
MIEGFFDLLAICSILGEGYGDLHKINTKYWKICISPGINNAMQSLGNLISSI